MNRVLDDARDLISRAKSQEAILFLIKAVKSNSISCDKECYDQLTLLSSRLENLEITIRKGIISHRDANLEKNKITDDLLKFIASDTFIDVKGEEEKTNEKTSSDLRTKERKNKKSQTSTTNIISGKEHIVIQDSDKNTIHITKK